MSQVITTNTSSSVASAAIPSTKVRVTNGVNPVFYAVGANPVAYAGNCEIIAANQTQYINMQGLGNKIAFLGNANPSTLSIQPIGTVYASSITAP